MVETQEYEIWYSDRSKKTSDSLNETTRSGGDQKKRFGMTNVLRRVSFLHFLKRGNGRKKAEFGVDRYGSSLAEVTRGEDDQKKSNASCLPYEILEQIFRWYLLSSNSKAPCLVSKHWGSVASETLYERVAPRSFTAVGLLLRTLMNDPDGHYKRKIKKLHLPIVSWVSGFRYVPRRSIIYDESGIPILSKPWKDVIAVPVGVEDLNVVVKTITRLFSFCPNAVEIHASLFQGFTVPPGMFLEASKLRRLLLMGEAALKALTTEVFEKTGTSSFVNLESIGIYGFVPPITPIDLEHLRGKVILPRLHTLHLQDGELYARTLFELLTLLESTLVSLSILRTDVLFAPQNTELPNLQLHSLRTLTIDMSVMKDIFRNRYIGPREQRQPPPLHTIEIRLLFSRNVWLRHTPLNELPTNLEKNINIEQWTWIRYISSSLKILRFITYFDDTLPQTQEELNLVGKQWRAAEGLKRIICEKIPDLEHLQVEVHERNVI